MKCRLRALGDAGEATFSLSSNPNDLAEAAEKWLREQSKGVLVQIIAQPRGNALLDRVPWFTSSHLSTAMASVVVELAKEELRSREEAARSEDAHKARRVSWFSFAVSVLALVVAGLSFAWTVIRSPPPKHEVRTIAPQPAPPKLLPGTKFQQQ
jgi:hypothetical protein